MARSGYISAKEAAEELGISLATLYSYVSRGLIRSEKADEARRTRRYSIEDVEKLKARKEQRRNPAKVVANALHWGAPIMESAITLISDNRFFYKGQDALNLATTCSFEEVATLIWRGELPTGTPELFRSGEVTFPDRLRAVHSSIAAIPLVKQFQTLLPVAAADDLTAYDLRPSAVAQTGARILRLLVTIAAGCSNLDGSTARCLQKSWVQHDPQAADLINVALILCADHELNVSSFTARCVASAGATPYHVVLAGLAALQGAKHGRNSERVEAFLREVESSAQVRDTIAGRLKRGESLPGFGHRLYPLGDPRGKLLLDLIATHSPESPVTVLVNAVSKEALALIGEHPNIDFGLIALAWTLNLPPGAPMALFALGRTVGWIGHAIEQYQIDRIIRPRAKYVGELPVKAGS